ncbi:hypothetical protein [Crenothrix polyspora]|uniref:Uncharacterized protein n=1 Tax=Crenothrix polyspora TaxID=360316 RepID=A0A1R4GYY2_9GAMM|nr:hypothetical protein [Crenothrix polyspora]SJM89162.1 hypothetical protein CRENPOLYSF1_100046 [Crenothrix polyspora]
MYHTEIDLPDELFSKIDANLKATGATFKQFVQQALGHELQRKQGSDLKAFFSELQPLESFTSIDALAYVDELRSKSRIIDQ